MDIKVKEELAPASLLSVLEDILGASSWIPDKVAVTQPSRCVYGRYCSS